MTQYPEGMLKSELGIRYEHRLITDYDAGLEDDPSIEPVSHEAVLKVVLKKNNHKLKELIYANGVRHTVERAGTAVASDVLKTARG